MKDIRVAITGLGLMCGQGLNLGSAWENLVNGHGAAKRFTGFNPDGLSCTFGVELPQGADDLFANQIMTRSRRQMTRATMMAVVTARMALEDAGLDPALEDPTRIGAVIGATGTGYAPDMQSPDEYRILRNMANAPAL